MHRKQTNTSIAQRIEHCPSKATVVSSNLTRCTNKYLMHHVHLFHFSIVVLSSKKGAAEWCGSHTPRNQAISDYCDGQPKRGNDVLILLLSKVCSYTDSVFSRPSQWKRV